MSDNVHLGAFVRGAFGGVVAELMLYGVDLGSIQRLSFAGETAEDAQSRIVALAAPAIEALERDLTILHVVVGIIVGGLAGLALPRRLGRKPPILVPLGIVTGLHVLSVLAAVGHYPQTVAVRWWGGGGFFAALLKLCTHGIGPIAFDAIVAIALFMMCALALYRLRLPLTAIALSKAIRYVAIGVFGYVALVGTFVLLRGPRGAASERPNVLIIASDSLRTDVLEDERVMPASITIAQRGRLFRNALTPIARTFPSWVSALTGLEVRHTDIRSMFPSVASRRRALPTVFTELRDAGYRTFVVSDFAGDVFPRFEGGFLHEDTPTLTVDTLAQGLLLSRHTFVLPLLRLELVRNYLPAWSNVPDLADPSWLVDRTLDRIDEGGPFAGLVFFSTGHFPYAAPHPHYRFDPDGGEAPDYEGPFLFHVPPTTDRTPTKEDIAQAKLRYLGAMHAVDRATAHLLAELDARGLRDQTIVIVTGDHGEEIYEADGLSGHGDVLGLDRSQRVPIAIAGPNVSKAPASNDTVRLFDLPATILDLTGTSTGAYGDGVSLLLEGASRPICLETGLWFWPTRPEVLNGHRMTYDSIDGLIELDRTTRELVLRPDRVSIVEAAKARGLALGHRMFWRRPGPEGIESGTVTIPDATPGHELVDLEALFWSRCIDGDPRLARVHDAVLWKAEDR